LARLHLQVVADDWDISKVTAALTSAGAQAVEVERASQPWKTCFWP